MLSKSYNFYLQLLKERYQSLRVNLVWSLCLMKVTTMKMVVWVPLKKIFYIDGQNIWTICLDTKEKWIWWDPVAMDFAHSVQKCLLFNK